MKLRFNYLRFAAPLFVAALALLIPGGAIFGEYVTRDLSANKAQLDKFVLALEQDPTAQGYLIAKEAAPAFLMMGRRPRTTRPITR